ncbi:hypothetical protein F5B21DRAFT_526905 [Xylaria acuta]|nr:hypothetical protein F5B21DRAFT_526905 [Xylaria acuta]
MSVTKSLSSIALDTVLEQISVQLDGTTGIVKIPTGTFTFLDAEGQAIAKRQASSALGHPVEFYLDSTYDNRVYLASLASINIYRPCVVGAATVSGLSVLLPAPPQKKTKMPNGFSVYRSHHSPLVEAEIPGIKNGEISTILASRWRAMTDEEKEPWLQLAKAKSEAKHAEGPVFDSGSARANKRRRTDQNAPQSSGENHRVSQDLRDHRARAFQSSPPFGKDQPQTPSPSTLGNSEHSPNIGDQHLQSCQAGAVSSDNSARSSKSHTPTYHRTLQRTHTRPIQAREVSHLPLDYSLRSSANTTLESQSQSQTMDRQSPPSSWTSSLEISVQSPACNELGKSEQSQNTAGGHARDPDGILSPAALSKLMREVGWEPFSLDFPHVDETQ